MKKSTTASVLFILSGLVGVGFSNCSNFNANSSVDFASSSSVRSAPILAASTPDAPVPPPLVFGPAFSIAVSTTCSDIGTANLSGNIIESTGSLTVKLTENTSGANCSYSDPSVRDHLIRDQKLVFPSLKQICPLLDVGDYTVTLVGNGTSADLLAAAADPIAIRMGGAAPLQVTASRDEYGNIAVNQSQTQVGIIPSVLMGHNQTGSDVTVGTGTMNNLCDQRASPLLVQLHPGDSTVRQIKLTSPGDGVLFDILGHRALPAFAKQFISWFTPETAQGNYFIVLPDAGGNVSGVDQMFGNNTLGPDGAYAANGYEALRKYDTNHDGQITAKDPIFSQLRLWMDSNSDGISQPLELYTLDQMKVTAINLNYDSAYGESDLYGNQIKLRSVVQTSDGMLHVMYDIWFKYYQ